MFRFNADTQPLKLSIKILGEKFGLNVFASEVEQGDHRIEIWTTMGQSAPKNELPYHIGTVRFNKKKKRVVFIDPMEDE